MASTTNLEDLNVTKDELKKIGDALKDENFRKLFIEYAQEISDPENRRKYEEEITQMENERGMDIQFVHPNAGHVLETSVDGQMKCFINITQNDKIDKPWNERKTDKGVTGMMWQIPHSFSQPREDVDNGAKCQVFDVVFHPDTYRMSETNERFLKLVHDTAIDGIEKQFDKKIDRKNLKKLSMKYKGVAQASVIRTKRKHGESNPNGEMADILKNMPYPYDNRTTADKTKAKDVEIKKREEEKSKKSAKTKKLKEQKESTAAVPEYTITHRSDLDLQEYRNAADSRPSTRPKELVVKISLPLLPSASCASLDIFEQRLKLESKTPAAYTLDIKLPYPVNDEEGSAKFDKNKRCLTVTLPVLPAETPKLPSFIEDENRINGDSHETEAANENNDGPKIEVLSSSETSEKETKDATATAEDLSETSETSQVKTTPKPTIAYSNPAYTYNQDAETITFIFNVQNISEDSITKSFPEANSIKITFVSVGSGGFPMYYCLFVRFEPSCKLASEHCTTDLTEANLVLVLLKDKTSRSLWDRFEAGLDAHHLQEKLLLTDVSLQKQLNQLDEEAEHFDRAESHPKRPPLLKVTEMKDKKLTINIQAIPTEHDEDDDYDPPSSADIEVVHKKAPPKLHSILKQRTMSESSDDYGCSGGESPRSSQEDSPLDGKKSVSFNSHDDSITYKKNTAPTSMKTALKSKRRRARKKEEKKANSRRRRNSGSEGSSGEEHSHESHSCDDKTDEEDGHFDQIAEVDEAEITDGKNAGGEGNVKEKGGRKKAPKESKKVLKEKDGDEGIEGGVKGDDEGGEGSVKAEKDNQDFRTSVVTDCDAVSEKKKMMVEEIKKQMSAPESNMADSDDEGVDCDLGSDERTNVKTDASCVNGSTGLNEQESEDVISSDRISSPGDLQQIIENQDSSLIKIKAANKEQASESSETKESEKGDLTEDKGENSDKIETMLSWKDNVSDPFNDHKTQCAFTFTNSVIYDLDVD